MIRILIADDNKQITEVLKAFAIKEGMDVDVAYDGKQAFDMFKNNNYNIILLDIMMLYIDGYELLKMIRLESMVPVILITAKGEDYERIMGLDYGADDYIVKPFSVAEVMARMRAILRRVEPENATSKLKYDNLMLDEEKYICMLDGKELKLTKKEFEILWLLLENKGKVYTRDNLLDSLWGYDYYGDPRTVDTHIKRLRSKLGKDNTWSIATVRGMGYKFEAYDEK